MFFGGAGGGGFPPGFPPGFGGFGGMPGGGMPGGGGGGGRGARQQAADTSAYYDILGVPKDAEPNVIRKAYLRASTAGPYKHPDKGGDPGKFAMLQGAYEVLSDADKRALYDEGGEEAVKGGGGGGGPQSQADLFEALFGGGRGGAAHRGPPKMETSTHPLRVTLEDCFKGKAFKVAINRTVIRRDPAGNVMDRQRNRYMRSTEREILDVTLERGAGEGHKIVFAGKGDIQDGLLQGDVVLVVKLAEHALFERQGADLVMKRSVSLLEAVTGVALSFRGVSGGVLSVRSPPGMVVKPEALLEVPEEGMPVLGHPQVKGSLFIKFDVVFPERLDITEGMRKILAGVLKGAPGSSGGGGGGGEASGGAGALPFDESVPVRALQAVDLEQRRQREHLGRADGDSDEEQEGGGAPGVQCAQQ